MTSARLWFLSLVAAMGGFLFGYDTAVINGAEQQIQSGALERPRRRRVRDDGRALHRRTHNRHWGLAPKDSAIPDFATFLSNYKNIAM